MADESLQMDVRPRKVPMRRLVLLSWLCGCAAVGLSSSSRAQVANPNYVNLYWEASASKAPPSTTGNWDGDVSYYANNTNGQSYSMTKDGIDSMLRVMMQSNWVEDMVPKGYRLPSGCRWGVLSSA
jgi:hypothetical protein